MIVKCTERFWDGERCISYYPGDQDDIDPLSPAAKYFEGWPPGTVVYTKSKGIEGTRVVPGGSDSNVTVNSGADDVQRKRGKSRTQ